MKYTWHSMSPEQYAFEEERPQRERDHRAMELEGGPDLPDERDAPAVAPRTSMKNIESVGVIDLNSIFHSSWNAVKNPETECASAVVNRVRRFAEEYTSIGVCVDWPEPGFRKLEIDPEYPKPKKRDADLIAQLNETIDTLRAEGFPVFMHGGYEADDCVASVVKHAMLATAPAVDRIEIISDDFDMAQLVDEKVSLRRPRAHRVYGIKEIIEAPARGEKGGLGVRPNQVGDFVALSGKDGIPGVPRVGDKTAIELLAKFEWIHNIIAAANASQAALEWDLRLSTAVENGEEREAAAARLGARPEMDAMFKPALKAALTNADNIKRLGLSRRLVELRDDAPIDFSLVLKPRVPMALRKATEERLALFKKMLDESPPAFEVCTTCRARATEQTSSESEDTMELWRCPSGHLFRPVAGTKEAPVSAPDRVAATPVAAHSTPDADMLAALQARGLPMNVSLADSKNWHWCAHQPDDRATSYCEMAVAPEVESTKGRWYCPRHQVAPTAKVPRGHCDRCDLCGVAPKNHDDVDCLIWVSEHPEDPCDRCPGCGAEFDTPLYRSICCGWPARATKGTTKCFLCLKCGKACDASSWTQQALVVVGDALGDPDMVTRSTTFPCDVVEKGPVATSTPDDAWAPDELSSNTDDTPSAEALAAATMSRGSGDGLGALLGKMKDAALMTPGEQEEQRRSFAFGNANISNPDVTREMIDDVADATGAPTIVAMGDVAGSPEAADRQIELELGNLLFDALAEAHGASMVDDEAGRRRLGRSAALFLDRIKSPLGPVAPIVPPKPEPKFITRIELAMADGVYHADPCDVPSLSASMAKILDRQSPLHAYSAHPRLGGVKQKPRRELDAGSIAHLMLLGKGVELQVIDAPDYRRTPAQEERDEARAAGKVPVLVGEYSKAKAAAATLKARFEEKDISLDGHVEAACFWTEKTEHGLVQCRAKIDHMKVERDSILITDLKSSESVNPDAIQKHIDAYRYDIQETAYVRALEENYPRLAGRVFMRLIFFELSPPFDVVPVELDGEFREMGRHRWERAVNTWARCVSTGKWPGFAESGTIRIGPAPWALTKEMER